MFPSLKEAIGFSCNPLDDHSGYTWTLTTWLGQFLLEAERLFGPRDREWTPLGIEFCGDTPHIWYPANVKHVSIMLTDAARLEPNRALFQLAHEVIHLLSPSGGRNAPIIEEGLATWFCDGTAIELKLNICSEAASYIEAKSLVQVLLDIDENAIKKIREHEPKFVNFDPDLICRVVTSTPRTLAERLCMPFVRGV